MHVTVRPPAVAGRFYSSDPDTLQAEVDSYITPQGSPQPAIGCISPHAGYMYSGHVAGAVYGRIEIPERCILLCPNHTGMGRPLAIMSHGAWETPLGRVAIDEELATSLKRKFSFLNEDSDAHRGEHAVEVQLPFLQERRKDFSFVPITLGTGEYEMLEALGFALADVVQNQERVLIVASSDMNHYENDHITRIKDHKALKPILALDPRGLFDVVTKEEVSMCGFGPTVAMLTAARRLGAVHAEVVKYATSGDVSGDRDMVVGYAGVIVR